MQKRAFIKKLKRQPTEWEKVLANHISDKILGSRLYKEHLQFNNKKISNPIKKWTKDLNSYFSKENVQMANKHWKRFSTSSVIMEVQIEITVKFHFTPTRTAIIKNIFFG